VICTGVCLVRGMRGCWSWSAHLAGSTRQFLGPGCVNSLPTLGFGHAGSMSCFSVFALLGWGNPWQLDLSCCLCLNQHQRLLMHGVVTLVRTLTLDSLPEAVNPMINPTQKPLCSDPWSAVCLLRTTFSQESRHVHRGASDLAEAGIKSKVSPVPD
jgi:hypothetical protein